MGISRSEYSLTSSIRDLEIVTTTTTALRNRQDADLRKNTHREDYYSCSRVIRHDRQCQEQDPGQGRHSTRPAAIDFRRKATRGRTNSLRLQHPEGVHSSPCSPSPWWYH